MDIEKLIEEAKERYPVGTTVRCLVLKQIRVVKKDNHKLHFGAIRVSSDSVYYANLYKDGEWAEIISLPEDESPKEVSKEETMFKKGDYIVLLGKSDIGDNSYLTNHCYKQREDSSYLLTELDSNEEKDNGWSIYRFKKGKEKWRYATQSEIDEYDRLGKPFDVTTLSELNTYGLKVGDKLPAKVISEWARVADNWVSKSYDSYQKYTSGFGGDRKIEKIEIHKGFPAFLVSGTMRVYLKAEGFKEFMENFGKKKEYGFEVVHCTTQKEWDFVNSKQSKSRENHWSVHKEEACFVLKGYGEYSPLYFFQSRNSLIYSFKEWCDKFGHVFEESKKDLVFEENKWYKYLHPDELFYLLASKSSTNKIHYKEHIGTKSGNHSFSGSSFDTQWVTDIEVPLSEIQKYLPEGHPDKLPIEHCIDYYTNGDVIVYGEVTNSGIKGKGIRRSTRVYSENNTFIVKQSRLRSVTTGERQWLDACIKANKFMAKDKALEEKEEWIPKEGDWVVIIKGDSPQSQELAGQCVQLEVPIDNVGAWYIKGLRAGGGVWYKSTDYDDEFRKAELHEIPIETKSSQESVEPSNYWAIGTYIVFLKDNAVGISRVRRGDIGKIESETRDSLTDLSIWGCSKQQEEHGLVKWFATRSEAQEFSLSIREPEATFELPVKWAVKRTKSNSKVLNEWNNDLCKKGETFRWLADAITDNDYFYPDLPHSVRLKEGYTLITFEQFEEHVLKKTSVIEEETPEVGKSHIKSEESMFNINDKVRISPSSSYYSTDSYNPKDVTGRITATDKGSDEEDHCYSVTWDNGKTNCYREKDLYLYEKTSSESYSLSDLKFSEKEVKTVKIKETEIMEFKVGNRVRCRNSYGLVKEGMVGTVVHIHMGNPSIGVQWEGLNEGHDCDSTCPRGTGYYLYAKDLDLISTSSTVADDLGKIEVVHCATQEEWDSVATRLGRTSRVRFREVGDCINLENPNSSWYARDLVQHDHYRILTFKEWCDRFGYYFTSHVSPKTSTSTELPSTDLVLLPVKAIRVPKTLSV